MMANEISFFIDKSLGTVSRNEIKDNIIRIDGNEIKYNKRVCSCA